jgi:hypothetical protein
MDTLRGRDPSRLRVTSLTDFDLNNFKPSGATNFISPDCEANSQEISSRSQNVQ